MTRKHGLAETEERALKLGEIEKTAEMFQKGMLTTITYVDGKKLRDRAKVCNDKTDLSMRYGSLQ